MNHRNELHGAMAIVAAALGMDFVSGRTLAVFYAQTGSVSWIGIGLSAVLYGAMIGWIVHLSRRCGAQNMDELLNRLPGGDIGRGGHILYVSIILLAAGMLVVSAGRMGALVLPVHHADLLGGTLAFLVAVSAALSGEKIMKGVGGILALFMFVFELTLLLFAELPDTPRYAIELRLKGNWAAALGLALLHTAACLCLSAGLAVRFSVGRIKGLRMGIWAGAFFGLLLNLGNAVLMARDERILGLKLPFVALGADWGRMGFYLNTGLGWLLCVYALAGLIHGILRVRCRENFIGK